jgi:hypothetical protein
LVAAVVVGQGCGSSEYERRLQARVSTLGQESAFAKVGNAVQPPGIGLSIAMPAEFQLLPAGADAKRAKIPFAELAELKATYEATQMDSAGGKQHYYCYLAAADPANFGGGIDPSQTLLNRIRNAFPTANIANPAPTPVPTPSGKNETWQKFRYVGKQPFYYVDKTNQEQYPEMEGALEVWSRRVDEAKCLFMIIWRVPTVGGKDFVNLDQKAPLVAGSVTAKQ